MDQHRREAFALSDCLRQAGAFTHIERGALQRITHGQVGNDTDAGAKRS